MVRPGKAELISQGDDWRGMQTFDTTLRGGTLWLAVLAPPLMFWILVQYFVFKAGEGMMPPARIMVLIGLANALPLAALGWMVCSVGAYSVSPGKLIEHRVVGDREFAFDSGLDVEPLANGMIAVRIPGRTLRLRVVDPVRCLAVLREQGERTERMTSDLRL